MIVCTSEEAATKYCCMMPKKCHGAQCMAWNEIGSRGFCGAVPLPESMQEMVVNHQAADARYKLTVTPLQTGTIEHGMIISEHQPTNAMPEQVQAVTLPLDNPQSSQSQTIHKPKHKGAR